MSPAAAPDESLLPGAEVEIGGLAQRPAFNGRRGVVQSFDREAGCYVVALRSEAGEQGAKVSRGNLTPVAAPPSPPGLCSRAASSAAGAAEAASAPRARSAQRLRCRVADRIEGAQCSEGVADEPLVEAAALEAERRMRAAERLAREAEQRALAAEQRAREAEQRAREAEQRAREDEAVRRAQIVRLVSESKQVIDQAQAAEETSRRQLGGLALEKQQLQRQADAAARAREEDRHMYEAQLSALKLEKEQFRQEAKGIFRVMEDSLKSQLRGLELNRERFQQHLAVFAQSRESVDTDIYESQLSVLESEKEQFRQEATVIFRVMEDTLKSQLRGVEQDREQLQRQIAAAFFAAPSQVKEADELRSRHEAEPNELTADAEHLRRAADAHQAAVAC